MATATAGGRERTETKAVIKSPSSVTFRAIILLERKVQFRSSRIELTKALRLTLHTGDSNDWRRGFSGTVSTMERARTQLTRLSFHRASSLPAMALVILGRARGRPPSTTTITPPAGTTIMRLSALEFSGLNIFTF